MNDSHQKMHNALDFENDTGTDSKDEKWALRRVQAFALASIAESLKVLADAKSEEWVMGIKEGKRE
jgi:hypothetical protein